MNQRIESSPSTGQAGQQSLDPGSPPRDATWLRRFRRLLLSWYRQHARQLPWRQNADAYRVWISEIMLQQTQVATVIPYFERFLAAFPTVADLAAWPEEQVLRLWEGLGYYRRARQLHAAAGVIVRQHEGSFPSDVAAVRALPGIGRYTAAAITSIAFGQREPIVEANTRRLYARLLAHRGELQSAAAQDTLWQFADELLPQRDCGTFNQALMELGATVCQPRSPSCDDCPVAPLCPTRAAGLQDAIPRAAPKPQIEPVREVAVIVLSPQGKVLVLRYRQGQRWAGLWDFVRFPIDSTEAEHERGTTPEALAQEVRRRTGCRVEVEPDRLTQLKHGVTRYRITLDVYLARLSSTPPVQAEGSSSIAAAVWIEPAELEALPLSTTGRKLARLVAKKI